MREGEGEIIFVSGTDTDAGKSYATGWLAAQIAKEGKSVATMKFVQTGNVGYSEDIEVHRRIMGTGLLPEDALGLTAPE
ncbi:MAG: AAA family ATPase, partial [Paramuribaculum sp.]|nr:AAA family ATPase [Paramuribaculum sp.]